MNVIALIVALACASPALGYGYGGYGDYGFEIGRQLSAYGYGGYGDYGVSMGRMLYGSYAYGDYGRSLSEGYGDYGSYGRALMQEQMPTCQSAADIIASICADEELGGDADFASQVQDILTTTFVNIHGMDMKRTLLDMLEDPAYHGTVFWPAPSAFFTISEQLNSLGFDKVAEVIMFHMSITEQLTSSTVTSTRQVDTLGPFRNSKLQVAAIGDDFSVTPVNTETGKAEEYEQALVEYADIMACNAVVHIIDRVLFPTDLTQ